MKIPSLKWDINSPRFNEAMSLLQIDSEELKVLPITLFKEIQKDGNLRMANVHYLNHLRELRTKLNKIITERNLIVKNEKQNKSGQG